jgi:hypothetical protein
MCAVLVVVANILREPAFQVAFVNCDDVIQEITAATPYPTLCDSILPRTFERSAERIHPQGSNRCGNLQSILGITIKDDEPRSGSRWIGTVKKSIAAIASRRLRRKVSQRLAGSGSLGARFIQREIVRSETSKPSMRSSPWMRGAPHVEFSTTIRKINS